MSSEGVAGFDSLAAPADTVGAMTSLHGRELRPANAVGDIGDASQSGDGQMDHSTLGLGGALVAVEVAIFPNHTHTVAAVGAECVAANSAFASIPSKDPVGDTFPANGVAPAGSIAIRPADVTATATDAMDGKCAIGGVAVTLSIGDERAACIGDTPVDLAAASAASQRATRLDSDSPTAGGARLANLAHDCASREAEVDANDDDWYGLDEASASDRLDQLEAAARSFGGASNTASVAPVASFLASAAKWKKRASKLGSQARKAIAEEARLLVEDANDLVEGVRDGLSLTAQDTKQMTQRLTTDVKALHETLKPRLAATAEVSRDMWRDLQEVPKDVAQEVQSVIRKAGDCSTSISTPAVAKAAPATVKPVEAPTPVPGAEALYSLLLGGGATGTSSSSTSVPGRTEGSTLGTEALPETSATSPTKRKNVLDFAPALRSAGASKSPSPSMSPERPHSVAECSSGESPRSSGPASLTGVLRLGNMISAKGKEVSSGLMRQARDLGQKLEEKASGSGAAAGQSDGAIFDDASGAGRSRGILTTAVSSRRDDVDAKDVFEIGSADEDDFLADACALDDQDD